MRRRAGRPCLIREEFDRDPYGRITAHRALRFGILEGEATFSYLDGRLSQRFDSLRELRAALANAFRTKFNGGATHFENF